MGPLQTDPTACSTVVQHPPGSDRSPDQIAAGFKAAASCMGLSPAACQRPCPPAPAREQHFQPGLEPTCGTFRASCLPALVSAQRPCPPTPSTAQGQEQGRLASAQQPCPPTPARAQGQETGPLASAESLSPSPSALVSALAGPEPCSPRGEEVEEEEGSEPRCATEEVHLIQNALSLIPDLCCISLLDPSRHPCKAVHTIISLGAGSHACSQNGK